MSAIKERYYFEDKDYRFKFSFFFTNNKLLSVLLQLILNLIWKVARLKKKNDSKTMAVISLLRIGDTVFSIPALRILVNNYSEYVINVFCFPESKPIYALQFNNINIHTIERSEFSFGRRIASSRIRKTFNKTKPEIIFDFTCSVISATLIFRSGARKIVGCNSRYFKSVYSPFGPLRTAPHFMDIYLDVVSLTERFERSSEVINFPVDIKPDNKILIHPFAIRKAKEWSLKKFIELADSLNDVFEVEIISPDDFIPPDVIDEIRRLNVKLTFTRTMDDLISVIRDCSVFISNDSGPTYIAALLGKPTFTIYGPTNPKYSLPFGENHSYYQKRLICSAKDEKVCFTLGGIYCPTHDCLNLVSSDEVKSAVLEFLNKQNIQKKKL
jgi:heptosyltransferase-2